MTRESTGNTFSPRALMRRWILEEDATAITCQLDARGTRCYEVCLLPHWDPSSAILERFDAPAPARLRQAEVARRLRANGWIVIDHVSTDRGPALA